LSLRLRKLSTFQKLRIKRLIAINVIKKKLIFSSIDGCKYVGRKVLVNSKMRYIKIVGHALKMKLTLVFLSLNAFFLTILERNSSLNVDEAKHLSTITNMKNSGYVPCLKP